MWLHVAHGDLWMVITRGGEAQPLLGICDYSWLESFSSVDCADSHTKSAMRGRKRKTTALDNS